MTEKTPVRSTTLNRKFRLRVDQLSKEGTDLIRAHQDLTERTLRFAKEFQELWVRARTLDGKDAQSHQIHLRARLEQIVGTSNASILSRWNTIGTHAPALLQYKKDLPPQRDSLYELALAHKAGKPIQTWIKQELVTSQSSFRDVSALRKVGHKKALKRREVASVSVTLILRCSYEEAAGLIEKICSAPEVIEIKSHNALREAIKARLGEDRYDEVKGRFE